ncbi:PAS domain-containing sensor histidine kinase [Dictyobacter formicarum]|uniref:histidine kinase n=1 Tax=Dictyobacter formicarum TaxID=2778368 RepID=A0ABQ3VL97_9CHLR|nr:PAS domain-containing sensor histidine kinase [Dictyobacter formicarum]GHO86378.1 hypothetical protein KSZ_43840 [Dictyobacter formicarum]
MESDQRASKTQESTPPEQSTYIQQANANLFLALARDSADVFWLMTPYGDFDSLDSSNWKVFAGASQEAQNQNWLSCVHPLDNDCAQFTFMQAVQSQQATETECRMRRSDGLYRLIRLHFVPVQDVSGQLYQIIAYGKDITEQKYYQQMSEEQMRLAVSAAKIGLWDWDTRTNHLTLNDQCKALFGFPAWLTVSYEQLMAAIHPDDLDQRDHAIQEALTAKTEYSVEFRHICPDHSVRWLTLRGRWLYDEQGVPLRMIAAVMDITTLKHVEEQQIAAANKMTSILESISDAFFTIDSEWRYTYVNPHAEKLLGKKLADLLGQPIADVTPAFADPFFTRKFRQAVATQQANHFEAFSLPQKKWFEVHAYPTPEGLSVYYQDITERKRIERALRESELKFRRFVESNIIGVLVADIYGNIYETNQAYLAITGYSEEEIHERNLQWTTMTTQEYLPRQAQAIEEFLSTGISKPFEIAIRNKNGYQVPIMMAIAQLKSSSTLGVAIVLDISARKEVEKQKDVFLSIASHELRTPLTILKGTLQLIQRRMKRMASSPNASTAELETIQRKIEEDLDNALRQIDVQARLVNDLLDVSRIAVDKLELNLQRCNLIKILQETIEDLQATTPGHSLQVLIPPDEEIYVQIDPDRIGQVINNYVTNAIKYSEPGHPIRVGLEHTEQQVYVWVQDEGKGLTPEAQKHIWRRFYQLKESSTSSESKQGLGLGLYICQTIIQRHHGEVGVKSAPGQGSTFWFTLPLEPLVST